MTKLHKRLDNWGRWLNWDCQVGPDGAVCISIESRYRPPLEEQYDTDREAKPLPPDDVDDAADLNRLIERNLPYMEKWALAVKWAEYPAVMRSKRVSEHNLEKLADNAEKWLESVLKKIA